MTLKNILLSQPLLIMIIFGFVSFYLFYTPSTSISPERETVYIMETMSIVIKERMQKSGHSNVFEYVSQITCTQHMPNVITYETMGYIAADLVRESKNYMRGVFYDAWKQPIIVFFDEFKDNKKSLIIHSFGKNKKNNNGNGDDIMLWYNLDMTRQTDDRSESKESGVGF